MKKYDVDDQFRSENYQIYFKNLGEGGMKKKVFFGWLSLSTKSVTTKMQNEMKAVKFLF